MTSDQWYVYQFSLSPPATPSVNTSDWQDDLPCVNCSPRCSPNNWSVDISYLTSDTHYSFGHLTRTKVAFTVFTPLLPWWPTGLHPLRTTGSWACYSGPSTSVCHGVESRTLHRGPIPSRFIMIREGRQPANGDEQHDHDGDASVLHHPWPDWTQNVSSDHPA